MKFFKILYYFEALEFRLINNILYFYDKSFINVFKISGRFSEKYWPLRSLSVFSEDRNSLNKNK